MKTAKVTAMPGTEPPPGPVRREEEIRCRAYQLYEERGKTDGHDLEDWLRAEMEVMSHRVRRRAS